MKRILVLSFFLFANVFAQAELIVRRDSLDSMQGEIQSAGETGLLLTLDGNPKETLRIPWSEIIEIQPARSRPNIDALLVEGEKIWRANHRLLRGDIQLAMPLLEAQFYRLSGSDSSDSRLVAEGLLRALLAQGLVDKAIIPWLETIRLEEAGFDSPYKMLDPILEDETLLCRHLPIMVLRQIADNKIEQYSYSQFPKTKFFAQLVQDGVEAGTTFAQQLMLTSSGNEQASVALLAQYPSLEEWQKAWVNYAQVLFSQKNDKGQETKLYLAKVAAIDPSVQPFLTGLAMIQLADILEAEQKLEEAKRIRYEAKHVFPSHPYLYTNTDKGK